MINYYVLVGLVLRILSILLLVVYVAPIQFKELKRPARDNLVVYVRWTLFATVALYISQQILPISYQLTLMHSNGVFNLRNIATVTSNIGVLALSCCLAGLYKLANLLAKRNDTV